jgi:hypothetical protein
VSKRMTRIWGEVGATLYGGADEAEEKPQRVRGRGLHSSTFWLNLSAFCGIGGAFRGCLGGV